MKAVMLVDAVDNAICPTKIVCIGRNYVDHIHELGNEIPEEMVVFLKPNSAITTQLQSQHQGESLHYEAELCFLLQQGRFSHAAVGLDLTKRALQNQLKAKGLPWERAKAFDGAALFSPFIAIEDPDAAIGFTLSIDGQQVQAGHVDLMINKPSAILAQLQTFMSLEDGDVVMTGTPKGVGSIPANSLFNVSLHQGIKADTAPCVQWQWRSA